MVIYLFVFFLFISYAAIVANKPRNFTWDCTWKNISEPFLRPLKNVSFKMYYLKSSKFYIKFFVPLNCHDPMTGSSINCCNRQFGIRWPGRLVPILRRGVTFCWRRRRLSNHPNSVSTSNCPVIEGLEPPPEKGVSGQRLECFLAPRVIINFRPLNIAGGNKSWTSFAFFARLFSDFAPKHSSNSNNSVRLG